MVGMFQCPHLLLLQTHGKVDGGPHHPSFQTRGEPCPLKLRTQEGEEGRSEDVVLLAKLSYCNSERKKIRIIYKTQPATLEEPFLDSIKGTRIDHYKGT